MPISKHYGGKGQKVMHEMMARYGAEKGKRVFYATENKRKRKKGKRREQMIREFMRRG